MVALGVVNKDCKGGDSELIRGSCWCGGLFIERYKITEEEGKVANGP